MNVIGTRRLSASPGVPGSHGCRRLTPPGVCPRGAGESLYLPCRYPRLSKKPNGMYCNQRDGS
jgi:hypothetical protein